MLLSVSWYGTSLCPFPLYRAFPGSEYYGHSVALGLATGRRSRIPLVNYVRAHGRLSFLPFKRLIGVRFSGGRYSEPNSHSEYQRTAISDAVSPGVQLLRLRKRLQANSFSHSVRILHCILLNIFREPMLSMHALVPFTFRHQVSMVIHEPPSEFIPIAPGIIDRVLRRTVWLHDAIPPVLHNGSGPHELRLGSGPGTVRHPGTQHRQ